MTIGLSKHTRYISDNMAITMEYSSVENFVRDSEIVGKRDISRQFEYKLDDKAAKAKLTKGAKRNPFEVVVNSSSSNLIFSPGAWSSVVLPTLGYWDEVKGSKTCKIDDLTVRIVDMKTGKDVGGKHIDTQVIIFMNRDKVVLHCYNTTQLILVNGHGYSKLIDAFLKPYFEFKISMKVEEIKEFNETILSTFGNKTVKRSNVKYTGSPTFLWCTRCDFAAKSKASLVKHKKSTHSPSFISKNSSSTSWTTMFMICMQELIMMRSTLYVGNVTINL